MMSWVCAVMVAALLGVAHVAAAPATGSITGRAGLRNGDVAGVVVTVSAAGVRRTVVPDSQGKFTVDGLIAGVYRVEGALVGFRPAVAETVAVVAGRAAAVDLALAPGILSHLDYVIPADGMPGALKAADVVVHCGSPLPWALVFSDRIGRSWPRNMRQLCWQS